MLINISTFNTLQGCSGFNYVERYSLEVLQIKLCFFDQNLSTAPNKYFDVT